jgi:hypothetical protein
MYKNRECKPFHSGVPLQATVYFPELSICNMQTFLRGSTEMTTCTIYNVPPELKIYNDKHDPFTPLNLQRAYIHNEGYSPLGTKSTPHHKTQIQYFVPTIRTILEIKYPQYLISTHIRISVAPITHTLKTPQSEMATISSKKYFVAGHTYMKLHNLLCYK